MSSVILSTALKSTIASINRTERAVDLITKRFASGLKVNSALENPQSFFASLAIKNTAGDYSRLLDGIGQSIRTVQTTLDGLEATSRLIDQIDVIAQKSRDALLSGQTDSTIIEETTNVSSLSISDQILTLSPDVYYRLNETAGPIIDSGSGAAGPVNATYNNGASPNAAPLYNSGSAPSVQFDGNNDRIIVSNSTMINTQSQARRTVELVFNADDVTGRQVLYEEGAQVNGLTIYLDNDRIYFTAEDDSGGNRYADIDISAQIVAGQTYHAAFVLDAPGNTFSGYLDGNLVNTETLAGDALFPSHTGGIGIGGVNGGVQFHDGESAAGSGFNFAGRISDVAIHNNALTGAELLDHANSLNSVSQTHFLNSDYEKAISQIDQIAVDTNYRGINLLQDDDLITYFNPTNTNFVEIEGEDFTSSGLGLERYDFNDLNDVEEILTSIEDARQQVRTYGKTLVTELSILQNRIDFTQEKINTHKAGADDLTVSDQNKDGAELLASRTRLALGITALGLAANTQRSVLRLF